MLQKHLPRAHFVIFETRSHRVAYAGLKILYVAQSGLELVILPPSPPQIARNTRKPALS